ncbi:hypothetical protein CUJ89_08570 [Burkholderia pyrrocinia]|uniref:Uncharacterized protein n=1 Tax=Burkholderia pyrrocinia TaxID=60550 RepID=A0A2Z5MV74_BURPY|nr:hypothetical protein [Burkholderia pyrrocinia]AXF20528.1 hypothetical protein CUJ89_08570 [Burkholderia pyrrocinia]
MTAKNLDERLENWAKAQRYWTRGGSCLGSAEGRYRPEGGNVRSVDAMLIDELDADKVERAWSRLMPFDRDILRMHYILNMDPRVICRKLRIPHRPTSTFNMALAHGKSEIGKVLDRGEEMRNAYKYRERQFG